MVEEDGGVALGRAHVLEHVKVLRDHLRSQLTRSVHRLSHIICSCQVAPNCLHQCHICASKQQKMHIRLPSCSSIIHCVETKCAMTPSRLFAAQNAKMTGELETAHHHLDDVAAVDIGDAAFKVDDAVLETSNDGLPLACDTLTLQEPSTSSRDIQHWSHNRNSLHALLEGCSKQPSWAPNQLNTPW